MQNNLNSIKDLAGLEYTSKQNFKPLNNI